MQCLATCSAGFALHCWRADIQVQQRRAWKTLKSIRQVREQIVSTHPASAEREAWPEALCWLFLLFVYSTYADNGERAAGVCIQKYVEVHNVNRK